MCHIHTNLISISWSCPKLRRFQESGPHCWKNSNNFHKLKEDEIWKKGFGRIDTNVNVVLQEIGVVVSL